MKKLIVWLALTPLMAFAFSGDNDVKIKFDKAKCLDGRMSMDIEVNFQKETFKFSPSCNFTFSNRFKTKGGTECKVESGMCSSFSNREKFIVECRDGKKATVAIPCPSK